MESVHKSHQCVYINRGAPLFQTKVSCEAEMAKGFYKKISSLSSFVGHGDLHSKF